MRTHSDLFGCFAAGHFAPGHLAEAVATVHRHFVGGFGHFMFVAMHFA
jgi:hypothetical protein